MSEHTRSFAVQVQVSFPLDLALRVRRFMEHQHMTKAQVIKAALVEFLDAREKLAPTLESE